MRASDPRVILLTLAPIALAAPAAAQESATRRAADAFGERIGVEQVGLYGEGNVRGFDLESAGAYRIEGSYFARQALISDAALSGVSVRVGASAARLDYPSPSGVVDYRLRDTSGPSTWRVSTGFRDYETFVVDAARLWTSEDRRWGVSANVIARPAVEWGMGTKGSVYELGVVGRFEPSEALRVRTFASAIRRSYDGDYGIVTTGGALPGPIRPRQNYSPDWARVEGREFNGGAILDGRSGDWSWAASAFRSAFMPERADFTLLKVGADGSGTATFFHTPDRSFVSDSLEAKLFRDFTTGPAVHRLGVAARWRGSEAETVGGTPVALGPVDIDAPPAYVGGPNLVDDGRRVQDRVDQSVLSVTYGLVFDDRVNLRLGAHRSRYEKSVVALDGTRTDREEARWLYNASLVWNVSEATTLFGSWVTGLEETGVAPNSATNRNEILPTVEAEQKELGVRIALGERLSLTGALFESAKPTTGFRADGSFGLVGQVTHRGIEGSLAGQPRPGTNIVVGGVLMDAEVSGDLVTAGTIGAAPPGISRFRGLVSIEQDLAFAPGWSADAYVTYDSDRWVDSRNTIRAPSHMMVNLGVRKRFQVGETDVLLRAVLVNAFEETGWWASSSEEIWPVAPRTFRATLTATF